MSRKPGARQSYTSYTLGWPQAWRNPLGNPWAVLETDVAYDFDSSRYTANWGGNVRHTGIDIKAGPDAAVSAIAGGTVVQVTRTTSANPTENEAMSLVVIVQHSGTRGKFFCVYGHIYADPGINVGSQVSAGMRLGVVKKAGTPSHLHFGINTSAKLGNFIYGSLGWGRVPKSTDPKSVGWVDPVPYLRQTLSW